MCLAFQVLGFVGSAVSAQHDYFAVIRESSIVVEAIPYLFKSITRPIISLPCANTEFTLHHAPDLYPALK
jgi:hypothetical protein